MVRATASSALVVLIGSLVIAFITRSISDGIRLGRQHPRGLPDARGPAEPLRAGGPAGRPRGLGPRRARAHPDLLGNLRRRGMARHAPGQTIVWSFLWIVTVLLLAGVAYILVSSWVEYRLNPDVGAAPTPRERTLLALFSNAFVIVLAIITAMTVLTEVGINIAPLLAGAGVVGLAIGFGAQKLVQDIINGAFIQFENTMNEGDVVTAGGVTGVVEKLTIRSVSLRDLNGTIT
jgi:moderate conductance mechanosensitive channel